MTTERFVKLTVGQYELALEKLLAAGENLKKILDRDDLDPAGRLTLLRTLGEVECLLGVLESRRTRMVESRR